MNQPKKILFTTLTAVTVLSMLAGCQKTPETSIVTQKNQEKMIEAAQSGGENSSLLSALEVPERFTGEWKGVDDCVIVTADTSITLPEASAVPAATVTRHAFTQEDADKLMEVFLKGNLLYEEVLMTKQNAQKRVEELQAALRGDIPLNSVTEDHTMEELPGMIETWAEIARTAPDEKERFPVEETFQPGDFGGEEEIYGYADVDGKKVHAFINNRSDWSNQALFYLDGYGDMNRCYAVPVAQMENPVEVTITKEEAIQTGDALMKELDLENTLCDQITAVAFEKIEYGENLGVIDSGYELEYVRTVNGFPIAYTEYNGTSIPENDAFIGVWAYERITVDVSENGIVYFNWTDPYTEPVIRTEDTQLLNFDDVSDIFAKMILVKNSDLKAQNDANGFDVIMNIDISDVRLSLMRIRSKDNFSEGVLIPVWDFWGTTRMHAVDRAYSDMVYEEGHYEIALTINAIDGTIIDRNIGY